MRYLLAVLMIVSFFFTCQEKKEEKVLFPLAVDNYWEYNYYYLLEGDTNEVDTFQMKVISQMGDTFYLTGSLFTFEELEEDETTKIVKKDSFYFTFTDDEPDTQLLTNLDVLKTWKVNDEFTCEVISKEEITIDNQKYADCWHLKYQNEDGDIIKEIWLKEDIGIVKLVRVEDEEEVVLELKNYNLKR